MTQQVCETILNTLLPYKEEMLSAKRKTVIGTPMEKIGIYVDIQNLYYGAKTILNNKIDFRKLISNVSRGRMINTQRAYLINNPTENNQKFIHFLTGIGFKVVEKEIKVRSDGSSKGNVRIEMIADIMGNLDYFDTVCLVAGDGDFSCLGSRLKEKSVRLEVYSFVTATAMDLKQVANEFYEVDESYVL